MLRRDDPSPAPWTKDGQRRIEELGLTMQVNNCLTVTCFSQFSLRSGFAQLVTHWCRPRKFRVTTCLEIASTRFFYHSL